MRHLRITLVRAGLAAALMGFGAGAFPTAAEAASPATPGEGVTVQPVKTSIAEENFQTLIIMKALEELGYTVKKPLEVTPQTMVLALSTGDADFAANFWDPLSIDLYEKAGGADTLFMKGTLIDKNLQGYLIDRKTAEAHGITNLGQLKDPAVARLFDADGDGKADLTGCNAGWSCEAVIEHHLDAYDLHDTVEHNQGSYFALMADTITRFKKGEPILYYTWTPLWVSGALVPGEDVTWLEVPHTSLPDEPEGVNTRLPDGRNIGWSVNRQRILANKAFAEDNPAAATLFEIAAIPVNDVSEQNARMRAGEDSWKEVSGHADEWIAAHRATFDSWLKAARQAAR